MKYSFAIFLLSLVIVIVAGCDNQKGSIKTEPTLSDSARPDSEVKGAKIYMYDKGRITTEILAKKINKFDAKDSTVGYDVHVNSFDSTGKLTSVVVGDSSISHENSGKMSIYGNVVAISPEDSSKLETDYIHWNPAVNKFQTDAFVKITRRGDVATGWGLEADQKLTHVTILKQVSGSFHDTTTVQER